MLLNPRYEAHNHFLPPWLLLLESRIVCCDTHWKRCIRTNLQKFHLMSFYNQDAQVQTYIRKLWSLSLVPPEDVVKVW